MSDAVSPLSKVQAVLFDLDNTLYDRDLAFAMWARAFVAEQFAAEAEPLRAEALQQLITLDDHGYVTKQVLFTQAKALYPTITAEVDTLCQRFYREWLIYMKLEHETTALLDALDTVSIPYGIITNGPVHQNLKIERLGLEHRVRCLFISEVFGCSKPDPAIFQAAATALNVPNERILFVGDNPTADICGASGVKMKTAWLHRGAAWPAAVAEVYPDFILGSLGELAPILNLSLSPA